MTPVVDAATLRAAFGAVPSGVVAVCAVVDGGPVGMAVSTFVPVSLDPPMVAFCVRRESTTWPRLRRAERLGISVLAESQAGLARTLAATGVDRLRRIDHTVGDGGAVAIDGSTTFLSCEVTGELDGGDHTIVLLRIRTLRTRPSHGPLVFHNSRMGGVRHLAQPA